MEKAFNITFSSKVLKNSIPSTLTVVHIQEEEVFIV